MYRIYITSYISSEKVSKSVILSIALGYNSLPVITKNLKLTTASVSTFEFFGIMNPLIKINSVPLVGFYEKLIR